MTRYTGWRRLSGDTAERPDLLDFGKKLLGYLEGQRRLSGVKTCAIERTLPDGSIVRARFDYEIPSIEVIAKSEAKMPAVQDVGGFVTWPTDAAGAPALADSERVVLAGSAYRAIRKSGYSSLFPDVPTDPANPDSALENGLGHAGNVDWHGKSGWVLSWYGPRTRYMDFDTPLKPWVFFKGKVLVDLRDYVDTDATVLGAAVATFPSGQWLVVVSEDYDFARFERVSVLRLLGHPTDPQVQVDPASFQILNNRTHSDNNDGRHPWLFNPEGKEGRLITRVSGGQILERVIALVQDDGADVGFTVARTTNTVTLPQSVDASGYTLGEVVRHGLHQQVVTDRTIVVTAPGAYDPASPPPPSTSSGTLTVVTDEAAIVEFPTTLDDWAYASATTSDNPWLAFAVDYTSAGTVVYGYARTTTGTGTASGSFAYDSGGPDDVATPRFVTDAVDVTYSPFLPDKWSVGVAYNANVAIPDVHPVWHCASANSSNYIVGGVRMGSGPGAVEALAEKIESASATAAWDVNFAGYTTTDIPPQNGGPSGGALDPGASATVSCYTPQQTVQAGPNPSATPAEEIRTVASQSTSSQMEESLYLMHMDLRYGVLVVATEQVTTTHDESYAFTHTVTDYATRDSTGASIVGTHTVDDGTRRTWRTRAWVHATLVLDDTLIAADSTGDAPVVTAMSGTGPIDWPEEGAYLTYSLGALTTPPLGWTLPDAYAEAEWPHAMGINYAIWADLRSDIPPALAYTPGAASTDFPQVETWAIEVEPPVDSLDGTAGGATEIKVRWAMDLNDVRVPGSCAAYKHGWAVSFALPTQNIEAQPYRFFSQCGAGPIAARIGAETAIHYFPIWTLAPTTGLRR